DAAIGQGDGGFKAPRSCVLGACSEPDDRHRAALEWRLVDVALGDRPRKDIAQPREDPARPALAALLARAALPRGLLLPAPRPNSLDVRARDGVDRFRGECYRRAFGARYFR